MHRHSESLAGRSLDPFIGEWSMELQHDFDLVYAKITREE
jgi:hypothetical protein